MTLRAGAVIMAAALALTTSIATAQQSKQGWQSPFQQRGKNNMIVLDAHVDVIGRVADRGDDLMEDWPAVQTSIPKWQQGGVNAVFFALWINPRKYEGQQAVARIQFLYDALKRQISRHVEHLVLCDTAADVRKAAAAGKIAALVGIEGGSAINNNPALLEAYRRLHVRYMTLTWRDNLKWAGSSEAKNEQIGLNKLGREIIAEMNRVGIIPDLSHVSDKTFYDALEVSTKPVFVSHSNARSIAPHARNVTDDMLRALAKNGGVIGVNFWDELLRNKDAKGRKIAASSVTIENVLDQIDHIVKVAGIDHVGIGSDFEGVRGTARGLENAGQMERLFDGLRKRGYSEEDVRKIAGENFLRVMEANEQ